MTTDEVVVGLDDSPSARKALEWAADYARSAGLALRAVHVIADAYPPAVWGPGYIAVSSDGRYDEVLKSSIRTIFASVHPDPGWRLEFRRGPAGHELVNEARGARLLVVGTREHTGFGRLVTGSVSHQCLSHASCPVVAVPPIEVADDDTATRGEHLGDSLHSR